MTKKKNRSGKSVKFIAVFLCLLVLVPLAAVSIFITSFDVNKYRPMIEQAAYEKTGRKIKLTGEIAWSISLDHGFSITINDVSVGNPSWASRSDMAHIGSARLHLDLLALTRQQLNVVAFELNDTDIQLESNKSGQNNWTITVPDTGQKREVTEQTKSPKSVKININEVKILNSRLGVRSAEGKVSVYEIPELTFKETTTGISLHYTGSIEGKEADVVLNGGKIDALLKDNWPFDVKALYDSKALEASGTLSDNAKKVHLASIEVTSGKTSLNGKFDASLAGTRPLIQGSLESKQVLIGDFKSQSEETTKASPSSQAGTTPSDKIFSDTPLPLNALKSVDAHINILVDTLDLGATALNNVKTRIDLENGRLSIAPLTADIAGTKAEFTLKIDASASPPDVVTSLKADGLDLSQLVKLSGAESFISGKSNIDASIITRGNSPHDFAAHANGKISLIMDSGTLSSSTMKEVAGGLLDIFAPGAGSLVKPGINCLATRYVITNGLMESKGMLADTDITTIFGKGYINLPDERIGLSLYTKPKALGLGTMIPPMRITGDIKKPSFSLDAASAAQNIAGLLTNNDMGTAATEVPTLVEGAGVNRCLATLDSPVASPGTITKPLIPDTAKDLSEKVKDAGKELFKNFGGGLLGN